MKTFLSIVCVLFFWFFVVSPTIFGVVSRPYWERFRRGIAINLLGLSCIVTLWLFLASIHHLLSILRG